jgi:molybdopterin/thiamine biosynthesis adenylyltransferase
VGATVNDIGRQKVAVAADVVRDVNEKAGCRSVARDLRSREALASAKEASVIFGCIDNDSARLVLMELCCAYQIPYLDAASEFFVSGDAVRDFGGRVVVSRPGDFCLDCAGEINMEMAKAELEPELARKVREEHGYGFGPTVPSPAVVSLNGIVANIAVTEFLMMVSGIREPFRKSTYKGMRGVLQVSRDIRRPGCFNCEYLLGKGDSANIYRYAI